MATAIPVDVVRDVRNRILEARGKADSLQIDSMKLAMQAETMRAEALRLEMLYDKWLVQFPETVTN